MHKLITINPFSTNVPLLYSLKTSENRWFSDVFSGYRSGTLVENGLLCCETTNQKLNLIFKEKDCMQSKKDSLKSTIAMIEFFIKD